MSEGTQNATASEADDTVDVELAQQQAREFVEALIAGNYEQAFALFSDDLQTELIEDVEALKPLVEPDPEPIMQEFWRAMTSLYGPFEEIGEIDSELEDENVVVTVQLECEAGTVPLDISVNTSGNIPDVPACQYEPPGYVDESGLKERELSVETEDVSLGATVTLPANADQVPGVVLVHGAGGHDRDYSSNANKILKDLAWGLADRGIGSLRYDKRTYETDTPAEELGFDTVVTGDANAAITTIREIEEIDADSVFVVGHSLGGTCAPYIAEQSEDIAGIVNLDGYCIGPDSELTVEDAREYLERLGHDEDYIDTQIEQLEETAERIQSDSVGADEKFIAQSASWVQHHEEYTDDWLPKSRSLSVPFLIAKSGRYAPNNAAERVKNLRSELNDETVRVEHYEDLNHYFQKGRHVPNSMFESHSFRKPPVETVIGDIADFIFDISEADE